MRPSPTRPSRACRSSRTAPSRPSSGGYGAIADEILDELTPDAVLVPVGNGALLAGIGLRLAERGAVSAPDRGGGRAARR